MGRVTHFGKMPGDMRAELIPNQPSDQPWRTIVGEFAVISTLVVAGSEIVNTAVPTGSVRRVVTSKLLCGFQFQSVYSQVLDWWSLENRATEGCGCLPGVCWWWKWRR